MAMVLSLCVIFGVVGTVPVFGSASAATRWAYVAHSSGGYIAESTYRPPGGTHGRFTRVTSVAEGGQLRVEAVAMGNYYVFSHWQINNSSFNGSNSLVGASACPTAGIRVLYLNLNAEHFASSDNSVRVIAVFRDTRVTPPPAPPPRFMVSIGTQVAGGTVINSSNRVYFAGEVTRQINFPPAPAGATGNPTVSVLSNGVPITPNPIINPTGITFTMPSPGANVEVIFSWAAAPGPTSFTATIHNRHGQAPTTETRLAGELIDLQATSPAGYRFTHWSVDAPHSALSSNFHNLNSANTQFTMPSNNVTIRANFESASNMVIINNSPNTPGATWGGSPLQTVGGNQQYGAQVLLHPGTKAGYNFAGWHSDDVTIRGTAGARYFIMPSHQVSVTAQWVPAGTPSFNVTINMNRTTSDTFVLQNVYRGVIVPLHAENRPGYRLNNWSIVPATVQINNANSPNASFVMPNSNVTVTAHWVALLPPMAAPLPVQPTAENATYANLVWTVDGTGTGPYRIYVGGQPTTHIVNARNFDLGILGLGVGSHEIQVRALADGNVNFTESELSPIRVFRVNETPQRVPLNTPTNLSLNLSNVLTWGAVSNAVAYRVYVNGRYVYTHTGTTRSVDLTTRVPAPGITAPGTHNIVVRAIAAPGSNFLDSNDSAVYTHIVQPPPGEYIVTLRNASYWEQPTAPRFPVITTPVGTGNTFLPDTPIVINHGTRANYRFTSWTSNPSITITTGLDGSATFIMPPFHVEITANWVRNEIDTDQVVIRNRLADSFNETPNPSARRDRQTISGLEFAHGHQHVTVDAGTIYGYYFVRWASNPPGLVTEANRRNSVQTFVMPPQEVTLTALWRQVPVGTHTVSINHSPHLRSNETVVQGTVPVRLYPTPPTHTIGSTVHVHVAARPGYTFTGWSVSPAFVTLGVATATLPASAVHSASFTMPSEPVTVTANWERAANILTIANYPALGGNTPRPVGQTTSGVTHAQGSYVTIAAGNRPGYSFNRWEPASAVMDATNPYTTLRMPNNSLTVTAHWTAQPNRLDAPINVNITGNTVSWNHVTNSTGYRIYVNGQPVTGMRPRAYGNTFNLDNLSPRLGVGTHLIQVRAIGGTNHTDSDLSMARSYVITPAATPASTQPSGLSLVGSVLRWNPVEGASHYYLYVNGNRRTGISIPQSSNPTFNLATLNPRLAIGVGHDIQVRASVPRAGTTNLLSNLSETRRYYNAVPPLGTPRNVRIVGNPTLMWDFDPSPNLVGFRIYVNGQAGPQVGPHVRSFPIANLNLTAGEYLIGVRAIGNGSGNTDSYLSTFVQYVSTTIPNLDAPINLIINGNILTWNPVPNAVGYRVYVNGQPSTAGIIGSTSFNLVTLGLGAGTHLIQVRAIGNGTTHNDSPISAFATYVLGNQTVNPPGGNLPASNARTNNPRQYIVVFNAGDGSFPAGEDGLRMGPSGFVINSFTNTPTRAGYTFGGWQVGGAAVSLPLTVTGDMQLNAIWNRVETPATGSNIAPRGNPQTSGFGLLNIGAVVVLTALSVVAVKLLAKKKSN